MRRSIPFLTILTSVALASLTGCGGGSSGTSSASYTVGGTVVGLAGSGLNLQLNGGSTLAVISSGPFVFSSGLNSGAPYSVTVAAQPSSPSQTCVVTRGSGTVGSTGVTDVAVTCTPTPFTALL